MPIPENDATQGTALTLWLPLSLSPAKASTERISGRRQFLTVHTATTSMYCY